MANTFYHRIVRKLVIGFGNLFDNITLVRYNPDESESSRILVPIAYASKERYVTRLQDDPDVDKKVQMTLPRMSFQMTGFSYDATRKQNTNIKNFAQTPNGLRSQYMQVPYNFDFSLYIYVRNIEDATQVVEHILSYFTPDYTIKLNLIPEMGIVREIPVVLHSTEHEIIYEGDYSEKTRMVIWTINFTVKGYIYGGISDSGYIKHSITNILNNIQPSDIIEFTLDPSSGTGSYQKGELVYQGYTPGTATATARVYDTAVFTSNNFLYLNNIEGNFISSEDIIGLTSGASYRFTSHTPYNQQFVRIDSYVIPQTANSPNEIWTSNTVITEFD